MNDTTCSEKFSLDYDSHFDSNSDLCLRKKTVKRENLTTLTAEDKRYDHPCHQGKKKNETMNDNTIRL